MEKFFTEILSLIKEFVIKNWRKPSALLIVCCAIVYAYIFEIKKYVKGFELGEASLPFLVLFLFVVAGLWFYARFKHKLAVRKTSFGIIVNHENRSTSEIHRIIRPIIEEIKSEIKEIEFIELESHQFATEYQANEFLRNNDYGLKQLLHIKADIGKIEDKERFVIDSAVFRTYELPIKFPIFGITVDINKEVALRNPNQWAFSMANELEGTKKIRLELRDVIYYYLGLSSVCNGNPELGLKILKRLINPLEYNSGLIVATEELIDDEERIQRNKKFLLASRLVQILSGICHKVFLDYHNSGKDPHLTKGFLEEYAELLKGSREAIVTYIPLARYSYDLGDVEMAKEYTNKASAINPGLSSVLLNKGFFAILDDDANSLSRNYKLLLEKIEKHVVSEVPGWPYSVLDIIEFYNEQYAKYPDKNLFFDYAIAFHTTLSIDYKDGVRLLNKFQASVIGEAKYRALDAQARFLIKNGYNLTNAAKKTKVNKSAGKKGSKN